MSGRNGSEGFEQVLRSFRHQLVHFSGIELKVLLYAALNRDKHTLLVSLEREAVAAALGQSDRVVKKATAGLQHGVGCGGDECKGLEPKTGRLQALVMVRPPAPGRPALYRIGHGILRGDTFKEPRREVEAPGGVGDNYPETGDN